MSHHRSYDEGWNKLLDNLERSGQLSSTRVREAMERHPRWRFVPSSNRRARHEASRLDRPVPTGGGQTISAPHMVAILLEAGRPKPGEQCLDVGAGSGWLAALLGHLVAPDGRVVGIEIVPPLARLATENVRGAGVDNVEIREGDGGLGDASRGPYDLIIASCAAPTVPQPLIEQLATGGRLLIPVGERHQQHLLRIRRTPGGVSEENLGGCAFVPLIGEHGFG